MRKVILAAAIAATGLVAIPASAAPAWRIQPAVHHQIERDINQLDRRIDRAAQRRAISPREATSLRRDASRLQRSYYRFARNGLDRREVAQLERQVNRLHQQLRLERRDWDNRRG